MSRLAAMIGLCLVLWNPHETAADDPALYSLDSLSHHPYRYMPAYGHASQSPGSPKWFVPGYGYSIPGFGNLSGSGTSSPGVYSQRPGHNQRPYAPYSFPPLGGTSRSTHKTWSHPGSPWAVHQSWNRW